MKPLLLWKAPDDATFASRLDKRLKSTVLREWAALQEKSSAVEAAIREFGSLSLAERLNLVRSTALTSLRSIGYPHWENVSRLRARYREDDIIAGKVNHIFSHKKGHNAFQFVSVHAFESATKSEIEAVKRELYSPYDGSLRSLPNELPNIDAVFANHVMLSIRPVPAVRIERAFPSLRLITPPAIYGGLRRSTSRRRMQSQAHVSLFESWHFISGIVSEPQLRQRMKETTTEYIAHQAA
jgi:hypothetical protein